MRVAIDRSHGGNASPDVLDFSVSLNPLGPPPEALAAYHDAGRLINHYPPAYPDDLAARLARRQRVAPDNVVIGNGSTHLIYLLARTLRAQRPFVSIPTFSEIANAMLIAGARPEAISADRERSFALNAASVAKALELGADAIFIGRPNSPTGAMLSLADAVQTAGRCAERKCWCVFDEAFIDFVGEEHSMARLAAESSRVIVLRSLTKIFAIPGLRCGYLIAHSDTATRLRAACEPWSVNVVAEHVVKACLDVAENFVARSCAVVIAQREFLHRELAAIAGLRVFPSAANFLMLEIVDQAYSRGFAGHMRSNGIAVRDLRELPGCGAGMYRVAVRLHEENERLVAAARRYFALQGSDA
jgi:threonine-phosphate decarboxylase